MVSAKVAIIIGGGLVLAFLLAGGGQLTKESTAKLRTEIKLLQEGLDSRSESVKEKTRRQKQ